MNLQVIINDVADNADDFLGDAGTMIEARAAIRAFLADKFPSMSKPDSEQVIAGVLAILDEEGFFDAAGSNRSSAWAEGDEEEPEA
ncbi:MAG: hypothetical protein ACREIA_11910 [Opitutaceae bacterium]